MNDVPVITFIIYVLFVIRVSVVCRAINLWYSFGFYGFSLRR